MDLDKPKCRLVGTDGNVFAIIGTVSQALRRAKQPEKAQEFQSLAMASSSYDEVLTLCSEFVEVL